MAADKKITVRQIRSQIGRDPVTRQTLKALGLGRIGKEKTINSSDAVRGMLRRVEHLVTVQDAR